MLATRVPIEPGDGTPSFVLDGAVALADDFAVTIVTPRLRGAPRRTEHSGVVVLRHAYFPRRWERLAEDAIVPQLRRHPRLFIQAVTLAMSQMATAFRACRSERPGVIHAHWILPSGLTALLVGRLMRVPYIITSHGADAFGLESAPLRTLKRVIVSRSEAFVGVSREIIARYGGTARTTMLQPVGADFAQWSNLVGPRRPERDRILFVGRLDAKKGAAVALRALAHLPSERLRIVGDGPQRADLEALADELGLHSRVDFLGRLPKAQVAVEFRHAACLVIPSTIAPSGDRDGTPTVLAEAVAGRVPIVAASVAGIPDIITDRVHGLLHRPDDIEALAGAIAEALHDPSAAQARADHAFVELSWRLDSRVASARHADLYRGILSRPATRPKPPG